MYYLCIISYTIQISNSVKIRKLWRVPVTPSWDWTRHEWRPDRTRWVWDEADGRASDRVHKSSRCSAVDGDERARERRRRADRCRCCWCFGTLASSCRPGGSRRSRSWGRGMWGARSGGTFDSRICWTSPGAGSTWRTTRWRASNTSLRSGWGNAPSMLYSAHEFELRMS